MPVLSTMGLKKIWINPTAKAGTMPADGENWEDLGDVYKDTCTLKDSDPEITEHKSETSNKVVTCVGETETTVELTLMDPSLDQLAKYFGGEVSGVEGKKTWKRPKKLPMKEWAVWMQPEDGMRVGCAVVRIIPKFEITYSAKGICLVPMSIKFNDELLTSQVKEAPTSPGK